VTLLFIARKSFIDIIIIIIKTSIDSNKNTTGDCLYCKI